MKNEIESNPTTFINSLYHNYLGKIMSLEDEWKDPSKILPPNEVFVAIRGCDWSPWEMVAMRKDYKKPPPGCKNAKNYRKGWRWVSKNGDTLNRGEQPDEWCFLN